jgi:major capsid protein E
MMNTNQHRVVDPILTTHAQGYLQTKKVGLALFPPVFVPNLGGTIIKFGKESFKQYNARRAPGTDVKVIELGYSGDKFQLVQDALDVKVPREHLADAASVPGIDLGMTASNTAMKALTLALEMEQAGLAFNPDNYSVSNKVALTGTDKWSDPASDPISDIEDAIEAVRKSCGIRPNTMTIGAQVWKHLKNHPKILARFTFSSDQSISTKMLAGLFELQDVTLGDTVYADKDGEFQDVWGNFVVLAYVAVDPKGREEPSYGYTYTKEQHPFIEEPYFNDGNRSWFYGSTYDRVPLITGMDAGFLIQDVV